MLLQNIVIFGMAWRKKLIKQQTNASTQTLYHFQRCTHVHIPQLAEINKTYSSATIEKFVIICRLKMTIDTNRKSERQRSGRKIVKCISFCVGCWCFIQNSTLKIRFSLSLSLPHANSLPLFNRPFLLFSFHLIAYLYSIDRTFRFRLRLFTVFFLFTSIFRTFSRGTQNSAQKRSGGEREKKQFYSTISNRKQSMEIIAIAGFFCLYCSLFLKIFLLHSFHLCYSTYILLMIVCGWSSRKFALNRVSQSLKLFNKNPFVE